MSNIGDEILLLTIIKKPKLGKLIDKVLIEFVEDRGSTDDPYTFITNQRNALLHGEDIWSSGLEIAKYLLLLIYLSKIPDEEYKNAISFIAQENIYF